MSSFVPNTYFFRWFILLIINDFNDNSVLIYIFQVLYLFKNLDPIKTIHENYNILQIGRVNKTNAQNIRNYT